MMIKHVVCYKLANPTPELLKTVRDNFLSMKGVIPQVVDVESGWDFLQSERSYDAVLITTFNSKEDMAAYRSHPKHLEVSGFMHTVVATSVSVDFEYGL